MTPDDRLRALVEAAEAVVARWDTPLWKDAEPTARVINRLRAALSALNQPPRETAEDRAGAALWREHDGRHGQAEEAVSVFDPSEPRPPKATGEWSDVWAKADARETEGEDVEGLIERLEAFAYSLPGGPHGYSARLCAKAASALRSPQPWRPDREAVARIICEHVYTRENTSVSDLERACADAILALDHADGWRPIESAPRDGTQILIGHDKAAFDGWWDEYAGGWVDGTTNTFDEPIILQPTHWQPIPALPSKDTEG